MFKSHITQTGHLLNQIDIGENMTGEDTEIGCSREINTRWQRL